MFKKIKQLIDFPKEITNSNKTEYDIQCEEFHRKRKERDKIFIDNMTAFCLSKNTRSEIVLTPNDQSHLYNLIYQAYKAQRNWEDDPDIRHMCERFARGVDPHNNRIFTFSRYEKKTLPWVLKHGFRNGHYSPH